MKKFLFWFILWWIIVFWYFFVKENPDNTYVIKWKNLINKILKKEVITWIANPASTYCIENNGTLEIQQWSEWSIGICKFDNWSSCEERAFFRWECNSNWSNQISWENNDFTWNNEENIACTMEYAPVCAKVEIQCITTPCDPIEQTFWNRCAMEANKLATFLYEWECKSDKTECPQYTAPSPDFCKDWEIVDKWIDDKWCQLPPECITKE